MGRWPPGLALLLLCCCAASGQDQVIEQIQSKVHELQARQEQDHRTLEEMRTGMTMALCRPEIGQLVHDVIKECGTEICPGTKVLAAVNDAAPEHKNHFLRFMSTLRHVVFYLVRPGATEVFSFRRQRLRALVEDLLSNTSFLIVVQPTGGEQKARARADALQRASVILDKLRELRVDESKIKIWMYEVPLSESEILDSEDRPRFGEPKKDVSRGVWLFRVDC